MSVSGFDLNGGRLEHSIASGTMINAENSMAEEKEEGEENDDADEDFTTKNEFLERLQQQTLETTKNPYRAIDQRRKEIHMHLKNKLTTPKTLLQKAEEKKTSIERRLEDSEKQINELLYFGDELVSNIKITNEKRELQRREYEHIRRQELQMALKDESVEAMAHFDNITSRWCELKNFNEPMALFESLEKQKTKIADLMQSKDDIIEQCQQELNRINEKYYADQDKQSSDMYCLIERIDNQIELIKEAYKEHVDVLEATINDERQNIALTASLKWKSFYQAMSENEERKFCITKQKQQFYSDEIARISEKQDENTRAIRIRLEKDAEMLEWELRNIKNNILMNSEKLDYNYQVLQKRNEENVIINNQQKRRVGKINELISALKKKVQAAIINAETTAKKLTADIRKLHASISELEKKLQHFRRNNKKKFDQVWDINLKEIKALLSKVFEIDRLLHEQQLNIAWHKPQVDFESTTTKSFVTISEAAARDNNERQAAGGAAAAVAAAGVAVSNCVNGSKEIEIRLLRNVLRRIADRAGFLVEAKLTKILQPFREEEKCLVKIDNIFTALRITEIQFVTSLTTYFEPYAWCPNCTQDIPPQLLKSVYFTGTETAKVSPPATNETKRNSCGGRNNPACKNHYLVIEPALVLTALNEFTQQLMKRKYSNGYSDNADKEINLITIANESIKKFWANFATYIPKHKKQLWSSVEHGLNHYLEYLKQRAQLNDECMFLRKQNYELRHMLQKLGG